MENERIDKLVKQIIGDSPEKPLKIEELMNYVTDDQVQGIYNSDCPFCEDKLERNVVLHSSASNEGLYACGKGCDFKINFVSGKDTFYLPHSIRSPGLTGDNASFTEMLRLKVKAGETTKDGLVKQAIVEYMQHKIDDFVLSPEYRPFLETLKQNCD